MEIGCAALKLSSYFFKALQEKGIESHYVNSDLENATMIAKPATLLGKGLEIILRYKAVGSFIKRYGDYIENGTALDRICRNDFKR